MAVAGTASAQPRPSAAGVAAAMDTSGALQSPVTALGKRVRGLEGRVSTLEELLRKTQAASSFTCADVITSKSGAGATEDPASYACNYMDVRCRTSAVRPLRAGVPVGRGQPLLPALTG